MTETRIFLYSRCLLAVESVSANQKIAKFVLILLTIYKRMFIKMTNKGFFMIFSELGDERNVKLEFQHPILFLLNLFVAN